MFLIYSKAVRIRTSVCVIAHFNKLLIILKDNIIIISIIRLLKKETEF